MTAMRNVLNEALNQKMSHIVKYRFWKNNCFILFMIDTK